MYLTEFSEFHKVGMGMGMGKHGNKGLPRVWNVGDQKSQNLASE